MTRYFVLSILAVVFLVVPIPSAIGQDSGQRESNSLPETALQLENGPVENQQPSGSLFASPFRETHPEFIDDPIEALKIQLPDKQRDPESPAQTVGREFVEFVTSVKDWVMTGRNIWIVIAVVIAVVYVGNKLSKRR